MNSKNMNRGRKLLIGKAMVGFIVVTVIAAWLDYMSIVEGLKRPEVLFLDDILAGVIAAALLYVAGLRSLERQQALERRLQIVADMNHHIRNALQAMVYAATLTDNNIYVQAVSESVKRIEWALSEILPLTFDRNPSDLRPLQRPESAKIDKIHGPE